jgi:ABC-type polysaccharide/polyol phosphate transport system ATPase subunit
MTDLKPAESGAASTPDADADDIAIDATNVSKMFVLGGRSRSLRDRLTASEADLQREFWAVRNVSVQVPKGSMLGVIGRNGSGKSTFLRTLCGIYRPSTGTVQTRGRVTALLELGAGFHAELSGRENVYMNGAVVGLPREYMDGVMDEIIDIADIGSFIDAPIDTYSSGMRARLGFAVTIQLRPEILLADEITAVGDITFKEHGARRMQRLREHGATIVQVSHNLSMLRDTCDQILWLHKGEMMALGDPIDVVDAYIAHAESESSLQPDTSDEALNPDWVTRVDVAPESGRVNPSPSRPLHLTIGLDLKESVANAGLRVRFSRPTGVPLGLGTSKVDLGTNVAGPLAVGCVIPKLPLLNGRYRMVVEILDGERPVSVRRIPLEVFKPALDGPRDLVEVDAEWQLG